MSWYPRRRVFDGNYNVFKNLPGGGGGGSSTPAASTLAEWDANKNMSASAFLPLETSTIASATPITLTIGSTQVQTLTGTPAQVVTLPITGMQAGYSYIISSQNTGGVTVKAGDGTVIDVVPLGGLGVFTAWLDGANNTLYWVGTVHGLGTTLSVFSTGIAITYSGTQTTYLLPATPTPAASTLAEWDANANLAANAFISGTTSTATAAGTTTLTIASTQIQIFTGVTTQIVKLPTTSVPAGQPYTIINQSSGVLTVQSSGGNAIATVAPGTVGTFIAKTATPTAATDWTPRGLPSAVFECFTTTSGIAVPPGADLLVESLIAPGSGGGSGRRGAAGTVRCGGGSGASGAMFQMLRIPNALLSSTLTVTLPAGGVGGAAVTADNTNGNPGTAGLAASISSGSNTWSTFAGTAGGGGTATTGAAGVFAQGPINGSSGAAASVTGGVGVAASATVNGAPAGGGSGGGITSGDVANNGGAGGAQAFQYGLAAAAGGIVGGASPGTGNAAVAGIGGQGPGGGAASITGVAQAGATPAGYGAGGAGGGASLNGNNSGAGSPGGSPYFRGRWVYA